MDDEAIIALYFARNEDAIAETDRAHGAFCRRLAENILTLREDAEECVSDTYRTVWERIPPTVPRSLRTFLGRIVRDISISRWRAEHAQRRGSGMQVLLSELEDCLPGGESAEQSVERAALAGCIAGWLGTLSADDRALFLRRYWYGDQLQTLAHACGVPQGRLAQRMLRLRRSLRGALEQEGFTV